MKSICFTSETAQEEHNAVGDHYGVPQRLRSRSGGWGDHHAAGGGQRPRILLDGNLDEDWGDCLYLQPVLHHSEQKNYTVEITILPTEDETPTEFYLMALITA